ncbi:hypothetical protein [Reyranella sp.]|uniref:hypothetical protein n=1 Tax=Reyranella sp. TaxID=1929291 RepID=UPI003C79E105
MIAPFALLQLAYIACCLVTIGAIFVQQRYRLRHAKGCRWWLYTVLAFGLGYEALEAFKYGAPALPAGRWIVVPALAAVMAWSAANDWKSRNPPEI